MATTEPGPQVVTKDRRNLGKEFQGKTEDKNRIVFTGVCAHMKLHSFGSFISRAQAFSAITALFGLKNIFLTSCGP